MSDPCSTPAQTAHTQVLHKQCSHERTHLRHWRRARPECRHGQEHRLWRGARVGSGGCPRVLRALRRICQRRQRNLHGCLPTAQHVVDHCFTLLLSSHDVAGQ